MKPILSHKDYLLLKKASYPQVLGILTRIYKQGYIDGLREAEKEFDDAIVMNVDDAIERIGTDTFERMVSDEQESRLSDIRDRRI